MPPKRKRAKPSGVPVKQANVKQRKTVQPQEKKARKGQKQKKAVSERGSTFFPLLYCPISFSFVML